MRNKRPHDNTPVGPSQRQLRVGERIRHILAQILREGSFHDPALASANTISVTAVDVGPDLKHAHAYVMPLGGKDVEKVVEGLNRAAGYFRSQVAPEIDLRYTPKISFRIDNSFDEAERVANLLNQDRVQRDLQADDMSDDE